jgi:multiple antibiotic resistance protein
MDLAAFANVALSLFVIVDPVGCLPVFAAITRKKTREQRRATIRRAVTIAFAVLVVFALAGHWMLAYLGIGMPAVRIAGGILLFFIGIEMLYGRVTQTTTSAPEEEEAVEKDDVSITPLAIPFLAGPGSIAAVILLSGDAGGMRDVLPVLGAVALVLGATWLLLAATDTLLRVLGRIGVRVVARVMGLLLLFLSVQQVIDGLQALRIIEG